MSSHVAGVRAANRPTVICLHASGGSGGQWKALADRMRDEFRVLTPDLYGHGVAPAWPGAVTDVVAADAARISALAADAVGDVHLVGHSYGGAIALRVGLHRPDLVASLAVYEPVPMRILFDYSRRHRAATEVAEVALNVQRALGLGRVERASQWFVDYWAGPGQWARLAPGQQAAVAQRMPTIQSHFASLMGDAVTLLDYARLDAPVLLLAGGDTRASARRISELLEYALPSVEFHRLPGLGHLGPVTHADAVAQRIAFFVRRQTETRVARVREAA